MKKKKKIVRDDHDQPFFHFETAALLCSIPRAVLLFSLADSTLSLPCFAQDSKEYKVIEQYVSATGAYGKLLEVFSVDRHGERERFAKHKVSQIHPIGARTVRS